MFILSIVIDFIASSSYQLYEAIENTTFLSTPGLLQYWNEYSKIRSLIDEWASEIDIRKRPEIIATLYHLKHRTPHNSPSPDSRGMQISLFGLLAEVVVRNRNINK